MVAGASRDALLADLRTAVEKGLSGGTLETFRKDFAAIVARYGWSYNGGFEWRSRVIYETNLRSSYMAGRYQQLMAMRDTHPYWEYVHSDIVEHPRKEHLAWDGMVLRADDPWWIYHFPVNAWGCQCSVIARTEDDLRRMGKDGPDTAPPIRFIAREIGQRSPGGPRTVIVPEGIDPGFEHTPGRSRVFSEVPPPRGGNPVGDAPFTPVADAPARPAPLPAPHPASAPEETTDPVDAFLRLFGASRDMDAAFRDPAGQRIAIGNEMFTLPDGQGQIPLTLEQALQLAEAIRNPDEIWAQIVWLPEEQQSLVRRYYLTRLQQEGDANPLSVVFATGRDGWAGNISADDTLLQSLRQGIGLWSREE
ncbi:TPA: PBECR2 nuclease fold domain-containing protein [Pluralibacter gergoviae]